MPTTRVMSGLAEFLPGQGAGDLRVEHMVSRRPEPKYLVRCDRCQTTSTVTHSALRNGSARCRFDGCGKLKSKRGPDLLSEQRQRLAEREAERAAEERKISERRMAAETDGWERPVKYAPDPDPQPAMNERDRLALRERREAEEQERREVERPARERAEREQQRIAELQAEQQTTLRQLHAIERERVANGKDEAFSIDPATMAGDGRTGIPADQVAEWHKAQFAEFLRTNPDYFQCDENATAITNYLERNAPGLRLISAVQLTAAFKRLNEFGLLKERPAPKPEPVEQPKRVNVRIAPEPSQPVAKKNLGKDQRTGEIREFSEWEINRMSAEEYKRTFGIASTVGDLFAAMSDSR